LQKVDVYVYAGAISVSGYEKICELLREGKKAQSALLVLATPGGDPHAGFRIARAIQHVMKDSTCWCLATAKVRAPSSL
jgi:ClpP class serine protease